MKFISHLDMNRFMSRLISKSKIPVWYTEGFNQHIYMNFAVPLSLGFEGLYEIMDIRLTDDDYNLNKCLESVNGVCPDGIKFISVTNPISQMKEIGFADFKLNFENLNREIAEKIIAFLSSDSVICQKIGKKGKIKEIDIIPKIKEFSILDNTLFLCLTSGNEDNLNPNLVMSTFFERENIEPIFYTVSRTLIKDKNGNPFK
jgi:radical SAM-linked protein